MGKVEEGEWGGWEERGRKREEMRRRKREWGGEEKEGLSGTINYFSFTTFLYILYCESAM